MKLAVVYVLVPGLLGMTKLRILHCHPTPATTHREKVPKFAYRRRLPLEIIPFYPDLANILFFFSCYKYSGKIYQYNTEEGK